MAKKQKNYRLPDITLQQIAKLQAMTGMTETQVIISAIDRMIRDVQLGQDRQQVEGSHRGGSDDEGE